VAHIPPVSSTELKDARNCLLQNIQKQRKKLDMLEEQREEQHAHARAYYSLRYSSNKQLERLGLKDMKNK
jgi:hypothetical protein